MGGSGHVSAGENGDATATAMASSKLGSDFMRLFGQRTGLLGFAMVLVSFAAARLPAQTMSAAPVELVRETVQNEINSSNPTKFIFREREQTEHGTQTKVIVQTKDVAAGMLVAINDKPLTVEERQK